MNPIIIPAVQATKHAVMRTISVICVLLVCAGLYWAVYRTFIKPRPTESYAQKAETIQNYEYHNYYDGDSKFFIGIKLFGFKFGVSKMVAIKK